MEKTPSVTMILRRAGFSCVVASISFDSRSAMSWLA